MYEYFGKNGSWFLIVSWIIRMKLSFQEKRKARNRFPWKMSNKQSYIKWSPIENNLSKSWAYRNIYTNLFLFNMRGLEEALEQRINDLLTSFRCKVHTEKYLSQSTEPSELTDLGTYPKRINTIQKIVQYQSNDTRFNILMSYLHIKQFEYRFLKCNGVLQTDKESSPTKLLFPIEIPPPPAFKQPMNSLLEGCVRQWQSTLYTWRKRQRKKKYILYNYLSFI